MWVQIAENAVTDPAVFRDTTAGRPCTFARAATDPPTGTSDSFTSGTAAPPPADDEPRPEEPAEAVALLPLPPEAHPVRARTPTPKTPAAPTPSTVRLLHPRSVMSALRSVTTLPSKYGPRDATVQRSRSAQRNRRCGTTKRRRPVIGQPEEGGRRCRSVRR